MNRIESSSGNTGWSIWSRNTALFVDIKLEALPEYKFHILKSSSYFNVNKSLSSTRLTTLYLCGVSRSSCLPLQTLTSFSFLFQDNPISRIMNPSGNCAGAPGGSCGYASDPPPAFDLPPPPRPPWLEDLENCNEGGKIQNSNFAAHQLETCENTVIRDAMMTGDDFESAFHSVAVVVVCAILVVMFSLTLGVVIFR